LTPGIGYGKSKLFDGHEVRNKLSVSPNQVPDYKALAGDPSDNYIGAKGIGPKTAAELINKYDNIENLFKNINSIKNQKIKQILAKNKKTILIAKKLALIEKKVNLKFKIEDAKFSRFNEKMKKDLIRLEMKSLVARLFEQVPKKISDSTNNKQETQIELF
jgi:DNA polymerase-1